MKNYQISLDLDLTGRNKDNLIKNEPHTLTAMGNRAIIPDEGLFYEGTEVIINKGKALVRNVDYVCGQIHQDISEKSGLGVFAFIVVTNQDVTKDVTITYQAVGGPYNSNNKAIKAMYDAVVNDTRLIDWATGITGKPPFYNPVDHFHSLDDIIGWEPIIYQLERLTAAVSIGQAGLLKEVVNGVLGDFDCHSLEKILPMDKVMKHDAMLHALTFKKIYGHTTVKSENCTWMYGRMANFDIDTSGFPVGHTFTWRFYKEGFAPIYLPVETTGVVKGNGGIVRVYTYIPGNHIHENEILYIGVNNEPFKDEFDAVTYKLKFNRPLFGHSTYGMMATMRGIESDSFHVPGVQAKTEYGRLRYLMEHSGIARYKL